MHLLGYSIIQVRMVSSSYANRHYEKKLTRTKRAQHRDHISIVWSLGFSSCSQNLYEFYSVVIQCKKICVYIHMYENKTCKTAHFVHCYTDRYDTSQEAGVESI